MESPQAVGGLNTVTSEFEQFQQDVYDRRYALEQRIARLEWQISQYREESKTYRTDIKEMINKVYADVEVMKEQATRWKAGLAVILGAGGLIGMLIAMSKNLVDLFR